MIKSWSFSRLQDWSRCKYASYLKHAERVPDPNSAPAADRGSQIHQLAEDYVRGKITAMPQELAAFEGEFKSLRNTYETGQLELEGEWGLDRDWNVVPYKTAWGRVKLDLIYHMGKNHAAVVDYKTGRKDGNEAKHGSQLQFYATVAFCRFDDLQSVDAELWYLDKNELTHIAFEREKAFSRYLPYWNAQAIDMTTAVEFPPNPNINSCKYCPYGADDTYDKSARYGPTEGTGHCNVRHVDKVATGNFYARMKGKKS